MDAPLTGTWYFRIQDRGYTKYENMHFSRSILELMGCLQSGWSFPKTCCEIWTGMQSLVNLYGMKIATFDQVAFVHRGIIHTAYFRLSKACTSPISRGS